MSKFFNFKLFLIILWVICPLIIPNIAQSDEKKWSGDISLGYNQSNGNTKKSSFNASSSLKRMFDVAELLLKLDIYTASSNRKLDDQKWAALARYSKEFGNTGQWFSSYQVEVDHDRFADIDYRITPSAGIGYWIIKEDDLKWMIEGSLGYEMTEFRSAREEENSAVFVGHTNYEARILENAKFIQDLKVIPSLEDEGIRFKSETELNNPITESMDLSLKYAVDYDTEPSAGKKKSDTRFTTGIKYSF